jgi:hypothetical protein
MSNLTLGYLILALVGKAKANKCGKVWMYVVFYIRWTLQEHATTLYLSRCISETMDNIASKILSLMWSSIFSWCLSPPIPLATSKLVSTLSTFVTSSNVACLFSLDVLQNQVPSLYLSFLDFLSKPHSTPSYLVLPHQLTHSHNNFT